MREQRESDFFVPLDGVGQFRFGRRTYGDRIKIRIEYLRHVKEFGEAEESIDSELAMYAAILASFKVLCVEAPKGWDDLESIDMVANPDAEEQVMLLYAALKAKEDSFRSGQSAEGEGAGEGTS